MAKELQKPTFKELSVSNPKTNNAVDLTGGLIELKYYESILANHISATMIIVDSGNTVGEGKNKTNLLNGLPVRGGEPVRVRALDVQKNELRFVGVDGAFYVNQIKNVISDTKKTLMQFNLCTKEFIGNEQVRVQKRYSGKISESVKKIIDNVLESNKPQDIEETSNSYNFIGNLKKPLYTLTWLASKSIPSDGAYGKSAGFFFFETKDGYQFKSIDSLIGPTRGGGSADYKISKRFEYTMTPDRREGYGKILKYVVNKNINLQEKLVIGAYNSRFTFFNPYTFGVKHKDISMKEDQAGGKVKTAGTDLDFVAPEFTQSITRGLSSVLDVGTLPVGKDAEEQVENWKEKKDETNDRVQDRMIQALTRYNQIFSISVDIVIDGDFSLKAGDTIYCEFPEVSARLSKQSKQTSGLYLIASLCHKVTPTAAYTSLNLIRDSFGTKKGVK
tara:strand:- start:6731 stop:8068 length:1338 start_codon:yes stop_codon:yes gene_type:complete